MEDYHCQPWNYVSFFYYLKKYDKNWNEVLLVNDAISNGGGLLFPQGKALADGGFIIANFDGNLEKRATDGSLIWQSYSPHGVLDIVSTDDNQVIISTYQGLALVDADGQLDTTYADYLFDQLEIMPSGELVGVKEHSLTLLAPDFNELSTLEYPEEIIQDIAVADGRIAVLTDAKKILLYDENFILLQNFIQTESSNFLFLDLSSNAAVLAGKECFGSSCVLFLKELPFFEETTPFYEYDIGVTNIEISPEFVIWQNQDYYSIRFDELKITVQNFGSESVDHWALKSKFRFQLEACYLFDQRKTKNFSTTLLPGESVEVNWNNFVVPTKNNPAEPIRICISTASPNGQFESNAGNDYLCNDFLVSEREQWQEFGFQVFPNPASTFGRIQYQLPKTTNGIVRIFNSTGKAINQYPLEKGEGILNLESFPSGLYYVTLLIEGQIAKTLKFIQL